MALTKISRGLLSTGISDSSDATAITIDSSENVGIGTASPAHLLELVRSSTDFGATLEINNTSSANGSVSAVRYVTENETTGLMIGKHSNGFTSGADLAFINQELNSDLTISTNNTERMRINSSGNVGIGTTSPARPLEVTGSGDTLVRITGGSSNAKGIEFYKGSGTATQLYNVSDDLRIFTNATERMRIDSNGKVTVDPAGNFFDDSAGVLQLRASSATGGWAISARSTVTTSSGTWFIGKQSNGTNVFSLVSDSDSIDLTFLSDERMKMNITDSADVLDKVKQITVKDFDWRTELNGDTKDNTRETKKYGFIAQNFQSIGLGQYVKEVMPTDENDDTLGMDYGNITPILVKAIQEQQTLIETLQAKVEALENG